MNNQYIRAQQCKVKEAKFPFVKIGTQYWTTKNLNLAVTPQGNIIAEMQDNGNVEKIANGGFDTDTIWNKQAGWSINGGLATSDGSINSLIYQGGTANKWHKFTFTITSITSGGYSVRGGTTSSIIRTSVGTYTEYFYTTGAAIGIQSNNAIGSIDNVSIQGIGWSGSQELYDGIYAQTAEAASSVEKITNVADREFSSDTGTWVKGEGWNISNGTAVKTNGSASNLNYPYNPSNKMCKVTFTITSFTGTITGIRGSFGGGYYPNAVGTYTVYLYGNAQFGFWSDGCSIDNVSIKELGVAGQEATYQYAAVKAAAMWSNYNNDAPTGLIYGKLYNWFAVKLFQMDIDYYNAANPNKKWGGGWRIPTQTEFQTLSTFLGGDAVSGGKLKEAGLSHWNSPNTGADNSSGFSALGGGIRKSDGVYSNMLNIIIFSSFTIKDVNSRIWAPEIRYNDATFFTTSNQLLSTGCALRLIKA